MTILLPALFFVLMGPAGLVIGVLVGLLSDEVLYSVLVVKAAQALVSGKPFRFFPGLPELCLVEVGLIAAADRHHQQTVFHRYQLARDWLGSDSGRHQGRRFTAQLARIWAGMHQVSMDIDPVYLAGRIAQAAGAERRHELFGVLVQCCAIDPDGTDSGDLMFLYGLALAMDLPVLAFHQSLASHYCLGREACAILGIDVRSDRAALLQAARTLPGPEVIGSDAIIRRQAFAMIEDQLDALERTVERYRQATLREQR